MARIAIAANTAWNLANFRRPIIEALLARGDQVIVLAGPDGSHEDLRQMGCEVVVLSVDARGTNPVRDFLLQRRIKHWLASYRPHVLLNFTIKPVIFATRAATALDIPVINTITGLGTTFIRDNWITRVVERLYRNALPRSGMVLFQNPDDRAEFEARDLLKDVPVNIVSGSGIDLSAFPFSPIPRAGPDTFLLIARVLKDKGVEEFVEAARLLKAYYPDSRFQLLGPLGVANRTAISKPQVDVWVEEGLIEYLGATQDVRPFIEKAHCVVLPSYREGMPRALLEAAAMGRPLIATDVTGCREVVDHGLNGFLCSVRNPEDLAFKMRQFIDLSYRQRQQMGRESRKLAEDRFDSRKVVADYLDLIDRFMAQDS
jgi:glycosyltransferase involved in cell wall biosynthesis